MNTSTLLTVLGLCVLGGCVTAPYDDPTDDGRGPTLSIQREGIRAFVAATDATMNTGEYGCPLGSTQDPSFDAFVMMNSGSRLTVGASDPDGISNILVTLLTLSGHDAPIVSDIQVLGLASGTVQPEILPGGVGDSLTQIRVDFEILDPTVNRRTRTVAFDVDFDEAFRIVTTAVDANSDSTSLPLDGGPGSPANILFDELSACLN